MQKMFRLALLVLCGLLLSAPFVSATTLPAYNAGFSTPAAESNTWIATLVRAPVSPMESADAIAPARGEMPHSLLLNTTADGRPYIVQLVRIAVPDRPASAPEPASMTLLAVGLLGTPLLRRRRK